MARRKDKSFYNKQRSSKFRKKSLPKKETPTSTDLVDSYMAREGMILTALRTEEVQEPLVIEPRPTSPVRYYSPIFGDETPRRRPPSNNETLPQLAELSPVAQPGPSSALLDHSYAYYESDNFPELPGNRVVNLKHFLGQLIEDDHGPEQCGIKYLKFVREFRKKGQSCISSALEFKCSMCRRVKTYTLQPEESDLEAAVVHGTIAADGLVVGEDALVEIKCLSAADIAKEKCTSLVAAVLEGKVSMCQIKDEKVELKRSSHWYRQIQGQLNITGRSKCYLVLWTTSWMEVLEIERDDTFWAEIMVPKLEKFYMTAMLPEIVAPLYKKRMEASQIRILSPHQHI